MNDARTSSPDIGSGRTGFALPAARLERKEIVDRGHADGRLGRGGQTEDHALIGRKRRPIPPQLAVPAWRRAHARHTSVGRRPEAPNAARWWRLKSADGDMRTAQYCGKRRRERAVLVDQRQQQQSKGSDGSAARYPSQVAITGSAASRSTSGVLSGAESRIASIRWAPAAWSHSAASTTRAGKKRRSLRGLIPDQTSTAPTSTPRIPARRQARRRVRRTRWARARARRVHAIRSRMGGLKTPPIRAIRLKTNI